MRYHGTQALLKWDPMFNQHQKSLIHHHWKGIVPMMPATSKTLLTLSGKVDPTIITEKTHSNSCFTYQTTVLNYTLTFYTEENKQSTNIHSNNLMHRLLTKSLCGKSSGAIPPASPRRRRDYHEDLRQHQRWAPTNRRRSWKSHPWFGFSQRCGWLLLPLYKQKLEAMRYLFEILTYCLL